MARKILAYFLLAAIALQTFNRGLIVSGYYLKAYVKNCENKAKPQLHCNGRCQMMKKLNAEENGDKQNLASIKFSEIVSSKSFFASLTNITQNNIKHQDQYTLVRLDDYSGESFHPPGMKA